MVVCQKMIIAVGLISESLNKIRLIVINIVHGFLICPAEPESVSDFEEDIDAVV
jgi:hypothetical protein